MDPTPSWYKQDFQLVDTRKQQIRISKSKRTMTTWKSAILSSLLTHTLTAPSYPAYVSSLVLRQEQKCDMTTY